MRPTGDEGKLVVATALADGKVNVFVTALDKNNDFLNFLQLDGAVVGPGAQRQPLELQQTAAGKYVGSFEAADAGSYFMAIGGSRGKAPWIQGVNVPYSAEFREAGTNDALLASLAAMTPQGGSPGVMIPASDSSNSALAVLQSNSFRHDLPKAETMLDIWPSLVWLAGCLFFADLFTRRVAMDLNWVARLAARLRDRLLRREARGAFARISRAAAQPQSGSLANAGRTTQQRTARAYFHGVRFRIRHSSISTQCSHPPRGPIHGRHRHRPA